MIVDLDQLRASLTNDQISILDHIWCTYYQSNGNTWPSVQDVQVKFIKPRVLAALQALPCGTVYVENEQYRIELLGVLLTSDGATHEQLLADYLAYMRAEYRQSLNEGQGLKVIQSRDVAVALRLSEDQLPVLASTIHLGGLGGDRGAGGGPRWAAGIPPEIPDIMLATDLPDYVRDRAVKMATEHATARGLGPTRESEVWFVANPVLRAVLEADLEELSRVHGVGASKSSVVLAGGILEGMLLDVLSREEVRATAAFTDLRNKRPPPLDRWDLIDLVEVSRELSIIPEAAGHLSQALREFRNLVHPGKLLRDEITLTESEALVSAQILRICVKALAAYERKAAPPLLA